MRDADARRRLAEVALGSGARVKVAIVGGTGDFGLALARAARRGGRRGRDRLARRRARAGEGARGRRRGGAANEDAVARRRPRRARDEGRRRRSTPPRRSPTRSATTPRAQRRERAPLPTGGASRREARSLAERTQDARRGAGRRRPALARRGQARAGAARRGRASSAATTPTPRSSRSSWRRRSSPAARSTPARCASARALEGMTAVIVNLNKRYKGHAGIRVTGLP